MKNFVKILIDKKRKRYLDDYNEMVGEYKREVETTKGYNGRQILELLQNCDDEGSKEVLISIDKTKRTLSISNKGKPFSEEGYRSLFIANLSSKLSKRQYIGNKGLGFRSIINWSDTIEINSNGLSLIFSESNRLKTFNELFSDNIQTKIKKEQNFNKRTVPLPFLSIPEVIETNTKEYSTVIVLHYKEGFFNKINDQIKNITPETLLFLKHITEIKFQGFNNLKIIKCKRENLRGKKGEFAPVQKLSFDDRTWSVFSEEQDLPKNLSEARSNEKEFYQIKIAVEENFKYSSPYLYSFFPTNIKLNQPYVLHATFDLDSTRNQIVDSDKNRYLLKKVVDFTVTVAKYYSKEQVSYHPLEILNHSHRADTLDNLGYYELVDDAIKSEALFPCVDNMYRKLNEVIFVTDEFADMLLEINATHILQIHLIPFKDQDISDFDFVESLDRSVEVIVDYLGVLNNISILPMSPKSRSLFISQVVRECKFAKNDSPNQLNLLVNDQNEIIPGQEYIYTPITRQNNLKIPSFSHIQFLNKRLFENLLVDLDYEDNEVTNKGRFIYDHLNGFCNIHSYEPATLSQKVVSETNEMIRKYPAKAQNYIKEMNSCLFHNFLQSGEDSELSKIKISIPTLSEINKVINTEDLVFSDAYPIGKLSTIIFNGVYDRSQYIASPEVLGLSQDEDIDTVQNYLLWLNVNPYALYRRATKNKGIETYLNYVTQLNSLTYTSYEVTYTFIENFDKLLRKLTLNQLLLWIHSDEVLRTQMDNDRNYDVVKTYYRTNNLISSKPSYLKYILKSNFRHKFDDFFLDEKYSWVNDFTVNYNAPEFLENNISRGSINSILVSLGAKLDFEELTITKVTDILNKLPHLFSDGKRSQSVYRKALKHFRQKGEKLTGPVKLFADNGSGLIPLAQHKIYFSDKLKLPKAIRQTIPIFNFPPRAGGAEAIKFFKINDVSTIDLEIRSRNELFKLTEEFKIYFEKIKPLLLSQRINEVEEEEQKKQQASICRKIEIIFCSEIHYSVNGLDKQVLNYEFIHSKDFTYYVIALESDDLTKLRRNRYFIDSFADIISASFDITEKNDFKNALRSEFEEANQNVIADFGEDALNEARELLGLSDHKKSFWNAVLKAKGLNFDEIEESANLKKYLLKKLKIDYNTESIDYERLNEESELIKIQNLFQDIDLPLKAFTNNFSSSFSCEKLHIKKLTNYILTKKNIIKSAVWSSLKDSEISKQAKFLHQISLFENCEAFVTNAAVQNALEWNLDMETLFEEYSKSLYRKINLTGDTDLEKIKESNSANFTSDQLFEINQSERHKSLLYFANATDTILREIGRESEKIENRESETNTPINPRILSSDVLETDISQKNSKLKRKGPFIPKIKNLRKLKEKGNSAEQIVYNYLKTIYKNVYLVSEDDEGLHYDIRYTNEKGELRYVEVKTFDQNSFYLSRDEYQFGKNYKNEYEIWLLRNNQDIIPIKDFFDNQKYVITENEYLVHLKIAEDE